MTRHRNTADSVRALIGNTPLLRIRLLEREFPSVEFFAKAEWFNPGGSVKDRPALRMIEDAEREGRLRPGQTILEATSGNTGIALAMLGAAGGYPVRLCLPANASPERKRILEAYGAEVVLTDPNEGTDGAIRRAQEIHEKDPGTFYADQYNNPSNWKAHYDGTAAEIWEQTGGKITHFVATLGTSGTFVGTSRRLKDLKPGIRCLSLQPDSPFHGLEGMKHMASAIVPGIHDPTVADEELAVSTEDAYYWVKRLAREEGWRVGISSGAALFGCVEVAKRLPRGEPAVVVTVFPDSADRYLSERFWSE